MNAALTEAQTIAELVAKPLTVAVVGLSPKPHRDSYGVAQYMQAHGWRILPINPNASEILGEKAYATLTEADIKQLVVHDKWLATLNASLSAELDRVSQTLTRRIRELAERYATPLPALADEVEVLTAKVGEHLKRMGVV